MSISPRGAAPEPGRRYVGRVLDEAQRHRHALLAENERLRLLALSLASGNERLQHRNEALESIARENEGLQELVAAIEHEKARVQERVLALRNESARHASERTRLEEQLAEIQQRSRGVAQQFDTIEHQNTHMAQLYVATYQLHGSVSRPRVLACIQEILANLVGSQQAVIFETDDDGTLVCASASGMAPDGHRSVRPGEGTIGRSVATGETFLAGPGTGRAYAADEPELTACVPLRLSSGRTVGAVAVFRLLPQKRGLADLDRELLALVGTHGATALYCARLHAAAGGGVAA